MIMNRRRFLLTASAAPAIVAASSIMPISLGWMPDVELIYYGAGKSSEAAREALRTLGTTVGMGDGMRYRITRIVAPVYRRDTVLVEGNGRPVPLDVDVVDYVATLRDRTWRPAPFAMTRALSRLRKLPPGRLVSGLRRDETTHAPWPIDLDTRYNEGERMSYLEGKGLV